MKISFKIAILFSCIFTHTIKTSAPLTEANLRRWRQGLPLKPRYTVPTRGKPLTRKEQYDLGTHYLRSQETNCFFEKPYKNPYPSNIRSKNPYTRYEQEKFERIDSAKRYPALHEYLANKNRAKS